MKKHHFKLRNRVYPVIWSGIVVMSVYLLIRFATLSFSDDVGQADLNFPDALFSKLCCKVLEEGSSLVGYTTHEEEQTGFPIRLVEDQFAIQKFTYDASVLTARAQEYSFLLGNGAEPVTTTDWGNTTDLETGSNLKSGTDQETESNLKSGTDQETGTEQDSETDQGIGTDLETETDPGTIANQENDTNPEDYKDSAAVQTMNSEGKKRDIGYYEIDETNLSLEYILTNGAMFNSNLVDGALGGLSGTGMTKETVDELQIGYTQGNVYFEEKEDNASPTDAASMETAHISGTKYTLDQLKDVSFLVRNFYIVDKSTKVTDKLFDAEVMLSKDMKIKQKNDAPQILIYHTHAHEGYIDSRPNNFDDTVVGVGDYLAKYLKEKYNYNVIHDTTAYDVKNGAVNRDVAYTNAEDGLAKILAKYPTIEVVVDLHRDEGASRTVVINGKETAKIMLFNGLCRDQNGPITYLDNPNLQDNLAFSLQMQLKSLDLYPGLFIRNYLKSFRFNMHVRPKCLLVELGTENNTLQSAKNAMEPFAKVLDSVLQGK